MKPKYLVDNLCITLKKLGFNEPCKAYRKSNGEVIDSEVFKNTELEEGEYSIPTLFECVDWLRTKNIYISCYPIESERTGEIFDFRSTVIMPNYINNLLKKHSCYYKSWDFGIETALKELSKFKSDEKV